MPEERENLLQYYRTMRAALLAAIDGLDDAVLAEPSLDGWSVANHLVHVAAWDELRAREVQRISAGHASAWRTSPDQEEAFNDLVYANRRAFSPAQARWELDSSHQHVLDALASATDRAFDGSLYGEAGLRSTHEAVHTGWIRRWRNEKGL